MVQMVWTCILGFGKPWRTPRLHHLCRAGLLHSDDFRIVRAATYPGAVERPYRAIGYPVLPAIYIVMALFIDVVLLRYKPQYTWPGLISSCWGYRFISCGHGVRVCR